MLLREGPLVSASCMAYKQHSPWELTEQPVKSGWPRELPASSPYLSVLESESPLTVWLHVGNQGAELICSSAQAASNILLFTDGTVTRRR